MVDEEVEKRLKAKQSLTRRLFQEEIDEEDAKLQYEEKCEEDETSIRKNEETQGRQRRLIERTIRSKIERRN